MTGGKSRQMERVTAGKGGQGGIRLRHSLLTSDRFFEENKPLLGFLGFGAVEG